MKKIALVLVLATAALIGSAKPCEGGYCPSYRCYAPCGSGCVCISQPGQSGGNCYGVQHAERLLSAGAAELK